MAVVILRRWRADARVATLRAQLHHRAWSRAAAAQNLGIRVLRLVVIHGFSRVRFAKALDVLAVPVMVVEAGIQAVCGCSCGTGGFNEIGCAQVWASGRLNRLQCRLLMRLQWYVRAWSMRQNGKKAVSSLM